MQRESDFQARLIKKLEKLFPGCIILKNDANYLQGIPDLLILFNDKWAMLETKREKNSKRRPNQPYYVELLNDMSFCAFIDTENEERVLYDLQQALRSRRRARVSIGK